MSLTSTSWRRLSHVSRSSSSASATVSVWPRCGRGRAASSIRVGGEIGLTVVGVKDLSPVFRVQIPEDPTSGRTISITADPVAEG